MRLGNLVPVLLAHLISSTALAQLHTVNIDSVNYPGRYQVFDSGVGWVTGPTSLELESRAYTLLLDGCGYMYFSVASDGTVTSNSVESAEGDGNTLRFLVTDVAFDPGDYVDKYLLGGSSGYGIPGWHTGSAQVGLIRGRDYYVKLGYSVRVPFRLEADGTVSTTATDSLEAVNVTVPTIQFKTVDVYFDVNGLYLKYMPVRDFIASTSGNHAFKMVPGLDYQFTVVLSHYLFTYHVGADGNVSLVSTDIPGNTPIMSGNTVTLSPVDLHVETTSSYWSIYTGSYVMSESQTIRLLPNVNYNLLTGGGWPDNGFTVTEQCQLVPSDPDTGGTVLTLTRPDGLEFTLSTASNAAPFTAGDFEAPMGKKKKIGSTIPVKFQLFYDDVPVTSQTMLDGMLDESDCPRIRVYDVTEYMGEELELPEDYSGDIVEGVPDNVGAAADDCFRFTEQGDCIYNLKLLDSVFLSEHFYLVAVELGDYSLTPGNAVFETK